MKETFEITKYYKYNRKVSKSQGVMFMIFGMVVLGLIIYGLIIYSRTLNEAYQNINYGIDCSEYTSLQATTDNTLSAFETSKLAYQKDKQDYYNAQDIDTKVALFDKWTTSYDNNLVDPSNSLVRLYNTNLPFYEHCYKRVSMSIELDSIHAYIGQESTAIDSEFSNNLKPQAESAGYVYDPSSETKQWFK